METPRDSPTTVDMPLPSRDGVVKTFVYGTLADRDGAAAVLDEFRFAGPAVLVGLHRVEGRYPTLAPGGSVRGRVLVTDEVAALDAYEGTERGLYVRVPVPVADGDGSLQVYVGDPARLDAEADADWPGAGTFAERVRRYVRAADVAIRREP